MCEESRLDNTPAETQKNLTLRTVEDGRKLCWQDTLLLALRTEMISTFDRNREEWYETLSDSDEIAGSRGESQRTNKTNSLRDSTASVLVRLSSSILPTITVLNSTRHTLLFFVLPHAHERSKSFSETHRRCPCPQRCHKQSTTTQRTSTGLTYERTSGKSETSRKTSYLRVQQKPDRTLKRR